MLVAQAIGSACITLATFAVAMVVMLAVNATGTLRLPAEAELYGMDLHEHGISAYPEYVITALGVAQGLARTPASVRCTHKSTSAGARRLNTGRPEIGWFDSGTPKALFPAPCLPGISAQRQIEDTVQGGLQAGGCRLQWKHPRKENRGTVGEIES